MNVRGLFNNILAKIIYRILIIVNISHEAWLVARKTQLLCKKYHF